MAQKCTRHAARAPSCFKTGPGGPPQVPNGLERLQISPKRSRTVRSRTVRNQPKTVQNGANASKGFWTAPGEFLGPSWGPPHDRPEKARSPMSYDSGLLAGSQPSKFDFGAFPSFAKSISASHRPFWLNNLKPTLALRAELRRAHPTRPRRGGHQTGG